MIPSLDHSNSLIRKLSVLRTKPHDCILVMSGGTNKRGSPLYPTTEKHTV